MLILVYVRGRIDPITFNVDSLVILETPQYTMEISSDNADLDITATTERNSEMFNYYGYNAIIDGLIPNVTVPEVSPLNLNPTNCLLENSFVLPKVA